MSLSEIIKKWIDGIFKKKTPAPLLPQPEEIGPVDPYPWYTLATKYMGQKEISGPKHNVWVVGLFKFTSYVTNKDETPWCAAFINWLLAQTGYKGTNSAAAKSFGKDSFGINCKLQKGAIVHIQHPGNHVTICHDDGGSEAFFFGLGGNQQNQVNVSKYLKKDIRAIKWPVKK